MLGAELGAQPPDVHVDRAGAAEVVVAPDLLQQLSAREDPARVLGQELQQLEFLERQVEHPAAQPGRVGGLVDGQLAGPDLVRFSGHRRHHPPADGEPDPGLDPTLAGILYALHLCDGRTTKRRSDGRRTSKETQAEPAGCIGPLCPRERLLRRRKFPEGEIELKRVLDLQPQNARARMDLGAVYLGQGQSKEAQEQFAKLVTQEPDDPDAHVGLGIALADQGNHEAAVNEYKTALRLDPRARGVYYRLGVSQFQLKQYDEAIASYAKEKELDGDDAELETALSDAYQAKGMTQQAQEARNKSAELRSGQRD